MVGRRPNGIISWPVVFRDEDQRADRQLEFTQIDLEMSFIERDDIYLLIEGLLRRVWKAAIGVDIVTPFTKMSFAEALNRYGSDKPDARFGMELADFTEEFRSSAFKVFSGASRAWRGEGAQCQRTCRGDSGPVRDDDGSREELWREGTRLYQGREWRVEIADREILQRRREASLTRKLAVKKAI